MSLREWSAMPYANTGNFTQLDTFTSEASLMAGHSSQLPHIPANFFDNARKTLRIRAVGLLSSTSTPTYLWTVRFHTSPVTGTSSVSGTVVGVTGALTTGSGVTNKMWSLDLEVTCVTPGSGSSALSVISSGFLTSPGLAAPYIYPIQPTTPDTATWTVSLDASQTYWPNITATCSASSASNAILLKRLFLYWDN